MKKLGKLSINPEKVIKNEELVNLRGGYDLECTDGNYPYQCKCTPPAIGLWRGCYSSQTAAENTLSQYCADGAGTCDQLHGIYTGYY